MADVKRLLLEITLLNIIVALAYAAILTRSNLSLSVSNAKELHLSKKISFIHSETFKDLRSLEKLDISYNLFETIDPMLFQSLENLKELHLVENGISFIHSLTFRNLRKLNALLLSINKLSSIEPTTFAGLTKLKYLFLGINSIESLDQFTFDGLIGLKYLQLNLNKLRTIHPKTFTNMKEIEIIELDNNYLSTIYPGTFARLTKLKVLTLFHNYFFSIDSSTCIRIANMQEYFINFNTSLTPYSIINRNSTRNNALECFNRNFCSISIWTFSKGNLEHGLFLNCYQQLKFKDIEDCFQECIDSIECSKASYKLNSEYDSGFNCYLFESEPFRSSEGSGWISFVKKAHLII
jgi:hypothetical protein